MCWRGAAPAEPTFVFFGWTELLAAQQLPAMARGRRAGQPLSLRQAGTAVKTSVSISRPRLVGSAAELRAAYTTEAKEELVATADEAPWTGLRFGVGERVVAHVEGREQQGVHGMARESSAHADAAAWESGTVVRCWLRLWPAYDHCSGSKYVDEAAPERASRWAAYQVMLDSGRMVRPLVDNDAACRAAQPHEGSLVPPLRRRQLLETIKTAPKVLGKLMSVAQVHAAATDEAVALIRSVESNVTALGTSDGGHDSGSANEEYHASLLRSEIKQDLWDMFSLAQRGGRCAHARLLKPLLAGPHRSHHASLCRRAVDVDEVWPIISAVDPHISREEVQRKFEEMDDDDSGHMDFGEMENLWWT